MVKNVYIIAEIGINHCGKINFAKKLINIAKIVVLMLLNFKLTLLKNL